MKAKKENQIRSAANDHRTETMKANLSKLESAAAALLVKKDELTQLERLQLLHMVNIAYHRGGKIDGLFSVDSSTECDFCISMRKAAEENPLMICGFCYAAQDAKFKEAVRRRHSLNAQILSSVLFSVEELATLLIPGDCRINEDGDTVNATMARNYIRIFRAHPDINFGYFYKASITVEEGLKAEGITRRENLPNNARFIHSSPMIGTPAVPAWHDDMIFTVYPDTETTLTAVAAGAHECNGRRCRACGYTCYQMQRSAEPLHIAEVLRTSKARRAEIRAAYDIRKAATAAET